METAADNGNDGRRQEEEEEERARESAVGEVSWTAQRSLSSVAAQSSSVLTCLEAETEREEEQKEDEENIVVVVGEGDRLVKGRVSAKSEEGKAPCR